MPESPTRAALTLPPWQRQCDNQLESRVFSLPVSHPETRPRDLACVVMPLPLWLCP